jgi:hypothetical protein
MVTFVPNGIVIPIIAIADGNKEGYLLYVEASGMLENDIWTVILKADGAIRHYTTHEVVISPNSTYNINT